MRRFWPASLRGQLALLIITTALLGQLAGIAIFTDERRVALEGARREQVFGRILTAVELLEVAPPETRGRLMAALSTPQTRLWLDAQPALDPTDRELADNRAARRLEAALAGRGPVLVERHDTSRLWRPWSDELDEPDEPDSDHAHDRDDRRKRHRAAVITVAVGMGDGSWLNLRSGPPPAPAAPAWPALATAPATSALITAVVLAFLVRLTRPLRALALAADRLGRGEETPPLPAAGPAELRRTTQAFNLMRERLHRFVHDRTRMLAAISHDLRTPLTSLRLRAEFIEDEETRTKILATLDEMQAMIEATLTFTREEASQEETRAVDLAALVESVCADLADVGRAIELAESGRIVVPCRPLGLRRAVRNLVDNALAYGGKARVRLERRPDEVAVIVEDDGPGIPETELERVFEPFHRLEPSRSTETGGVGLGLAIARTIARAHGGDIVLANRAEGGLRAMLTLPLPRDLRSRSAQK